MPQGGSAQDENRSRLTIAAQANEQIVTEDSILITNEQEEKELELIKPNVILDIPENEIKSNFY